MYKLFLRPILFCFDPEKVHYFTFALVKFISKIPFVTSIIKAIYVVEDKRLEREVFGLKFKNPVGLAAGFDKDAKLFNELSDFGFGFRYTNTKITRRKSKEKIVSFEIRFGNYQPNGFQ